MGLDTLISVFAKEEHKEGIYGTSSMSIITTTLLFTAPDVLFNGQIARPDTFKESRLLYTLARIYHWTGCAWPPSLLPTRQEGDPGSLPLIRIGGVGIEHYL